MPISFSCPHCGASTQVAEQYAGQSGPCKSCGKTIQVPFPNTHRGTPAPAPPSASNSGCILVALLTAMIVIMTAGGVVFVYGWRGVATRDTRMQCSNNLRQIALAMHNYHDVYKAFPPAYTVDSEGNKLHSWRTLLLPFLEQSALYTQIDLDRPWDAPGNRQLAEIEIPTYVCPNDPNVTKIWHTNYMVIVGPDTIFDGEKSCRFADVIDGTSNTILVVEVTGQQVSWMEPTDLSLEQMQMAINGGPTDPGSVHPGGLHVALADGSVRFIAATIAPKTLRDLITRSDGQVIGDY